MFSLIFSWMCSKHHLDRNRPLPVFLMSVFILCWKALSSPPSAVWAPVLFAVLGVLVCLSLPAVFIPGPGVSPSRLFSPANKLSDHTPRRGGTLNRKQHVSPAFQPPLPPVEAGGAALVQPLAELQLQQQAQPAAVEPCLPSLVLAMQGPLSHNPEESW